MKQDSPVEVSENNVFIAVNPGRVHRRQTYSSTAVVIREAPA